MDKEIERLKEELESHAWEISPAMAQAKLDELNREIERLKSDNVQLGEDKVAMLQLAKEKYDALKSENARLASKLYEARKFICVNVRPTPEREAMLNMLEEQNPDPWRTQTAVVVSDEKWKQLQSDNARLAAELADCEAKVTALQKELHEAKADNVKLGEYNVAMLQLAKEKYDALKAENSKALDALWEALQLLCSACEIARRKGVDTRWDMFLKSCEDFLAQQNMRGVTARTYRIVDPEDLVRPRAACGEKGNNETKQ